MLRRAWNRFRYSAQDWRAWARVRQLPKARLVRELDLHNYGGCQLFLADINGDGVTELLWLQSPGIFKSGLYTKGNSHAARYLRQQQQQPYCLTVTDQRGNILWQRGTPWTSDMAYLSHAAERMLLCYDMNGDGQTEVLVINNESQIEVLSGPTGEVLDLVPLPADNFAVLQAGRGGRAYTTACCWSESWIKGIHPIPTAIPIYSSTGGCLSFGNESLWELATPSSEQMSMGMGATNSLWATSSLTAMASESGLQNSGRIEKSNLCTNMSTLHSRC